jgi:hypothetical protein
MRSDSIDGRLMFGNFTQLFYQYDIDLDNLPVTLPNGMILLRSEYNGVDSLNVFYKWSKLPDSKPVFNSYTTFDSLTSHYVKMPVFAPKYHTVIYEHPVIPKHLQWEQSGSMLSHCGLSLFVAVWLVCISAKLFRLSV